MTQRVQVANCESLFDAWNSGGQRLPSPYIEIQTEEEIPGVVFRSDMYTPNNQTVCPSVKLSVRLWINKLNNALTSEFCLKWMST